MGWTTTYLVNNDALHELREDGLIGKKMANGINRLFARPTRQPVDLDVPDNDGPEMI